jgi:hypothetical protein
MKSILIALKGKGFKNMLRRIVSITNRYGITSRKMDRAMAHFSSVLSENDCGATFPITGVALSRNKGVVEKYQSRNIEFAVHGYYHVDHSALGLRRQISDLSKARQLFGKRGIRSSGFRSPYLRFHKHTMRAVSETGFLYDTSSSLHWDVLNGSENLAYHQAIEFYGANPAGDYPSLPRFEDGYIEIPYCLPDDESLVERLSLEKGEQMAQPWLEILYRTHDLGELFTLGLHPERIYQCDTALKIVLEEARKMRPKVWITRLDEIAMWWSQRSKIKPVILNPNPREYVIKLNRPQGLTVLGRNVQILNTSKDWDGKERVIQGNTIQVISETRPFVGISETSDPYLELFLTEQGYIVERTLPNNLSSIYLEYEKFSRKEERPLLKKLENLEKPLVRFGRWPNENKSALCVTGDIDALTMWDYLARAWRK